jgi:hypothetical protein
MLFFAIGCFSESFLIFIFIFSIFPAHRKISIWFRYLELKESNPLQYSISIWAMILANRSQFVNAKDYQPQLGLITPIITKNKLIFWSNYFLKWHDRFGHNDTEIERQQEIIWTRII